MSYNYHYVKLTIQRFQGVNKFGVFCCCTVKKTLLVWQQFWRILTNENVGSWLNFEKSHDNVLKAIRNLIDDGETTSTGVNFNASDYKDSMNRDQDGHSWCKFVKRNRSTKIILAIYPYIATIESHTLDHQGEHHHEHSRCLH